MKSRANLLFTVLILLGVMFAFNACNNESFLSKEEKLKLDSIHRVETKRVVAVLIASYVKPEFFSLNSKPLDFRTINAYRLKDSLQHIDSAFCSSIIKKIEADEISNTTFRWTEDLIPRAIIIDFKMSKTHELFNKKLSAMAGEGLYFISEPLFNETYDLALVDYGFASRKRCGVGRLILYKKVEGRWMEYKIFSDWIA
jgi:hypothetical protein